MIILYHVGPSVAAAKVRIVLNEKNLAWESKVVDVHGGEQFGSVYRMLNPNSVVPTLVHDARPIIESSVILQYLEDTFPAPQLMRPDSYTRAKTRVWMKKIDDVHLSTATLSFAIVFRRLRLQNTAEELKRHFSAVPDPVMRDRQTQAVLHGIDTPQFLVALEHLAKLVEDMEEALSCTDYLVGNAYSLADIAATPYINRAAMLGLNSLWSKRPHVEAWFERIRARSSFEKAVMSWFSDKQRELFETAITETESKLRRMVLHA